MDAPKPRTGDAGFSLIELLVAMFITLIISGAIYGLMTSTQTAFRREPELAERQQSIRVAMDLIERDIAAAGQGLPYFAQVFTINDDAAGPCAAGLAGCGPGGGVITAATPSDALEILATEDQCPLVTVCDAPNPGAAGTVTTNDQIPGCMATAGQTSLIAYSDRMFWRIQPATPTAAAVGGLCTAGAPVNGAVTTQAPLAFTATPALPAVPLGSYIVQIGAARIARYEIGVDPVDGAPALWRSTTGYFDTAGAAVGPPPQAIGAAAGGTWQLVARGVEDMQVEYLDGVGAAADPDAWVDSPPPAGCPSSTVLTSPPPFACTQAEADTLVRQVRVTLSARSMAVALQGQTTGADGSAAVRGRLVGVTAPRAALIALQFQNQFMR